MALNMLLSISPWLILLLISIIVLGLIIFLTLTERILKRKVILKQQREYNRPARRIKLLISSHEDPEKKLRRINALAKEIFGELYNIDSKISYYELADKFQKQGRKDALRFCQEMFTILYSGEEIQSKKTHELAKLLAKINQEAQEEKSFKKLEKNVRLSINIPKSKDNLFKKFSKAENKFIDKFAKEKKEPVQEEQNISKSPAPSSPTSMPQVIPEEIKTKRKRLQDLPLTKLFKFRKDSEITLTTEIDPKSKEKQISPILSSIKLKTPLLKKKTPKIIEKSTYQQIEDLQKEIIDRQKQIEKMRTQRQIQELQRTAVEVEINKKEQWPPVKFTPKHLNETRKMSPEMEKSFDRTNKEIALLENEIKSKQKEIRKIRSTPVRRTITPPAEKSNTFVEKIFGKSDKKIEKEIAQKRKQIEVVNLKREKEMYNNYKAPKIIIPKKQKIEATPQKTPIKGEDFIHVVDNMERIKAQIKSRRSGL